MTFDANSVEILRLNFSPRHVTADGKELPRRSDLDQPGWTFDEQQGVLQIRHEGSHEILLRGTAR